MSEDAATVYAAGPTRSPCRAARTERDAGSKLSCKGCCGHPRFPFDLYTNNSLRLSPYIPVSRLRSANPSRDSQLSRPDRRQPTLLLDALARAFAKSSPEVPAGSSRNGKFPPRDNQVGPRPSRVHAARPRGASSVPKILAGTALAERCGPHDHLRRSHWDEGIERAAIVRPAAALAHLAGPFDPSLRRAARCARPWPRPRLRPPPPLSRPPSPQTRTRPGAPALTQPLRSTVPAAPSTPSLLLRTASRAP